MDKSVFNDESVKLTLLALFRYRLTPLPFDGIPLPIDAVSSRCVYLFIISCSIRPAPILGVASIPVSCPFKINRKLVRYIIFI